jgi:hypothetical protein
MIWAGRNVLVEGEDIGMGLCIEAGILEADLACYNRLDSY